MDVLCQLLQRSSQSVPLQIIIYTRVVIKPDAEQCGWHTLHYDCQAQSVYDQYALLVPEMMMTMMPIFYTQWVLFTNQMPKHCSLNGTIILINTTQHLQTQ